MKSRTKKPAVKALGAPKSTATKSSTGQQPRLEPRLAPARLKSAARKSLETAQGARKTARSRLAKRASHEPALKARKIELRTSLARRPAAIKKQRENTQADPGFLLPSELAFREVARADWAAIRRLLVEAFGRTEESELVERLRAGREIAGEFVAEYCGRLLGYVAFCSLNARLDGHAIRVAGLAPLAVAGEFERRGVGTRLVVFGLENVRCLGHQAAFCVGEPSFYRRFGFSASLAARFTSPWKGPHFQALEFEPGALRGEKGETIWPEAFGEI